MQLSEEPLDSMDRWKMPVRFYELFIKQQAKSKRRARRETEETKNECEKMTKATIDCKKDKSIAKIYRNSHRTSEQRFQNVFPRICRMCVCVCVVRHPEYSLRSHPWHVRIQPNTSDDFNWHHSSLFHYSSSLSFFGLCSAKIISLENFAIPHGKRGNRREHSFHVSFSPLLGLNNGNGMMCVCVRVCVCGD